MRNKLLLIAALFIFAGAGTALASSVDPTIVINHTKKGGTGSITALLTTSECTMNCFNGSPMSFTLSKGNSSLTIDYTGTVNLNGLTIEFTRLSGLSYTCESDIFANCTVSSEGNVVMSFSGSGDCHNNGDDEVEGDDGGGGDCVGFIAPGGFFTLAGRGFTQSTKVTATAATPEPSTLLLLLSGLAPLIGLRRRRWSSGHAD